MSAVGMNTLMNLRVPHKVDNFLTSCTNISCTKRMAPAWNRYLLMSHGHFHLHLQAADPCIAPARLQTVPKSITPHNQFLSHQNTAQCCCRQFALLHNIEFCSGAHTAPYPMCTGGLLQTRRGKGMKFTAYLHVAPRIKFQGAIPPLPPHVVMAWCLMERRDFTLWSAGS